MMAANNGKKYQIELQVTENSSQNATAKIILMRVQYSSLSYRFNGQQKK